MSYPPTKKKKVESGTSRKCMSGSHQATLFETWGMSRSVQSSCTASAVSGGEESKHRMGESSCDVGNISASSDQDFAEDGGCFESVLVMDEDSSRSGHSDSMASAAECCGQSMPDDSWSGCRLEDISRGPSCAAVLPPLLSAVDHTVLFRPLIKAGNIPQPHPAQFRDIWDSNHVRMPCSKQSVYPVGDSAGEKKILSPRWDLIKQSLEKPIMNSYDLEEAILAYNTVYSKKWDFSGIHAYFSKLSEEKCREFFGKTLPGVVKLALQLPSIVTHSLPLLRKQEKYSVTLSQKQVACLLANAFLCTFPRRNATKSTSEYSSYPTINFSTLYSSDGPGNSISSSRFHKLLCLCHYFARVTAVMPCGVLTVERKVLTSAPCWEKSQSLFTNLHVDSVGTIENNGQGMLQVDFANKCIGGGVLGHGCLQEEIRFLISPELIVTRLFTEELDSNEVIEVTGAEMYSTYKGYGSNFEWTGNYEDDTARDKWARRQTTIVAMDALRFSSKSAQFKPGMVRREVNKAYCGFMRDTSCPGGKHMAVATGNWGCGAFGGDARLKAVLQVIAAAEANRDIVYFTFGDKTLLKDISNFYRIVEGHNYTVARVWNFLLKYCEKNSDSQNLFHELEVTLKQQ